MLATPRAMRYRPEIDGLRALAVLPVVLFHAGIEPFSGGYIGVDIFFVISGYLITTIILDDLHKGRFSLSRFYERRARRILPALLVVTLVCLPAAWLWLAPADLAQFSRSLVAVALFSSNILFWRESGYFDVAGELKPLLHTWSLAVEEQYYFFFPMLLLLVCRHRYQLVVVLALLFCASFALALWGVKHLPSASFYLLPTRAWELLIGSFAALYLIGRTQTADVGLWRRYAQEVGALIGLGLVIFAIFSFDSRTPMPGIHALLPTLGTALMILCAHPGNSVGRLLALRGLVAVGLMSYSAYLWHQPLFAFARHRSLTEPGHALMIALALITFAAAYITWCFVEKPWRDPQRIGRSALLATTGVAFAVLLLVGVWGHATGGFPFRFPGETLQAIHAAERSMTPESCLSDIERFIRPQDACVFGSADHITTALLGDSHAHALAGPLGALMQQRGLGLRFMGYAGCPPVMDVYRRDYQENHRCREYNQLVLEHLREARYETIILSARWALYLEGNRFHNGEGGRESGGRVMLDASGPRYDETGSEAARRSNVASAYTSTIRALQRTGSKIVLVYDVPEAGWSVPALLSKIAVQKRRLDSLDGSVRYSRVRKRVAGAAAVFDELGDVPAMVRIIPTTMFCDVDGSDARCRVHVQGKPLYRDDDHLSDVGANFIGAKILEQL